MPGGNNLLLTRTMALTMPGKFLIVNKYRWGRLDFFLFIKILDSGNNICGAGGNNARKVQLKEVTP